MLAKRIIPCLDCDLNVPHGRVVKGIEFKQIRYAGEPVELATKYYEDGADEIVFLDITASHERQGNHGRCDRCHHRECIRSHMCRWWYQETAGLC